MEAMGGHRRMEGVILAVQDTITLDHGILEATSGPDSPGRGGRVSLPTPVRT